jgi:uncharacterized protein
VRIADATAGVVLVEGAKEATTAWSRFRGLMFRARMGPDDGLVIRPCGSIHMMFMRFRIDAVFFNEDLKVTKVAHRVPTWRGLAFGGRGAKGVIELPAGRAEKVESGNQLEILD